MKNIENVLFYKKNTFLIVNKNKRKKKRFTKPTLLNFSLYFDIIVGTINLDSRYYFELIVSTASMKCLA